MRRARRAGRSALVLALLGAIVVPFSPSAVAGPVTWPTSTLVLSEVQTGGASASDEFVEIANQGAGPVDLLGLEVVYATSSGSTVTRKATWADSRILVAGQRTVIANTAGIHAGVADGVYTGGFAATGGAVALRVVGGTVIDAVGWGDATNAFVEGVAAPAPAVGSSIERLPGGPDGNGEDTNDNASDWFVQSVPGPQGLAAPFVPDPGVPVPTGTPAPTASPTTDPDGESDSRTDGKPDRDSDSDGRAHAGADAGTDADAHPGPGADADARADRRTDADAYRRAHLPADAGANARSGRRHRRGSVGRGWQRRHGRRRPHRGPRRTRVGSRRVRRGRVGRDRGLPRRSRRGPACRRFPRSADRLRPVALCPTHGARRRRRHRGRRYARHARRRDHHHR